MNTNDNFDALWEGLKEQVRQARGWSRSCNTMASAIHRDAMRFSTSQPSDRFDPEAAYVHVSISGASITGKAKADDLMNIAAIAIAGALDLREQAAKADKQ